MDFMTAVRTCLQKFATFQGRAARSEFWFFALFQFLVLIAASIIDAVLGTSMIFYLIAGLALIVPSISVAVRRLHDTNRSGWWYWLALVPIVGVIVLLIWFCTKGSDGPNDFGPNPLQS